MNSWWTHDEFMVIFSHADPLWIHLAWLGSVTKPFLLRSYTHQDQFAVVCICFSWICVLKNCWLLAGFSQCHCWHRRRWIGRSFRQLCLSSMTSMAEIKLEWIKTTSQQIAINDAWWYLPDMCGESMCCFKASFGSKHRPTAPWPWRLAGNWDASVKTWRSCA